MILSENAEFYALWHIQNKKNSEKAGTTYQSSDIFYYLT